MPKLDVVQLASDLIAIPSESRNSNAEVSDHLRDVLQDAQLEVEWLEYQDDNGVTKVSLVAKRGEGTGGIGFFSHSDTVPGDQGVWSPFVPEIKDGKLFGRGSCDMKGPLAATIAAAAEVEASSLQKPIYIIITSDEEAGFGGARHVCEASQIFKRDGWPDLGVIAEPTLLQPVYAHKGGYQLKVTAYGEAAHTSTDKGVSANFLIAPFLAEMAALRELLMQDEQFRDPEFDPPTNGFNMTLDDGDCANNVTAAKTVCTLSFRSMPQGNVQEVIDKIEKLAKAHGLELTCSGYEPFYTPPDAPVIRLACDAAGASEAVAVPYGTDALVFHPYLPLVVLGPGSIAQAHTVGEWLELTQLERAVRVYHKMIEVYCAA